MSENKKHGLDIVIDRAMFYRDSARTLVKVVLVLVIAMVTSVGLNVFLANKAFNRDTTYFGLTADGRAIQMVAMSEPTMPESAMLNWVSRAATCPFTYDFANYRNQLMLCQPHFTERGWDTFLTELKSSKVLNLVKENNLVVSSTVISAPAIFDKGVINGVMAWKVDVPVRIRYLGRQNTTTEDFKITLTIVRVNQLTRPDTPGVAISSIVTTPYREE